MLLYELFEAKKKPKSKLIHKVKRTRNRKHVPKVDEPEYPKPKKKKPKKLTKK